MENKLTYEYIRGLVEGEGCFSFCKIGKYHKIPAFTIDMNERDGELLHFVRDTMDHGWPSVSIFPSEKLPISAAIC